MAAWRTGDVCEALERPLLPSQRTGGNSFLVGFRRFNDVRSYLRYAGCKTKPPESKTSS